jgi:endonuclease YncB( thermonuclease family)
MKTIFLCLLSLSLPVFAEPISVVVNRVVDGDTFEFIVPEHPKALSKIKVRLLGSDAPEISKPKCIKEKVLGLEAKQFLKNLIEKQEVLLYQVKFDKYGGRILAKVMKKDLDISSELINNKLAVKYLGYGVKNNWCL